MKKRKSFMALLLSLLLCFASGSLAGCGLQDRPEAGRDVLVTVAVINDQSEKATISKFIKAFKASQPSIDVKAKYIDPAYYTPVLTDWAGNTLADVVWTAGDKHAPLSAAGIFEPLNSYFAKTEGLLDDIYPAIIDAAKLSPEKEEIYFAPRDYNKLAIAYNKDMFDDAGVAYPQNDWTWQEFMDTCKALRDAMNENKGNLSKACYPLDGNLSWMPFAYTVVKGFGGEFMNEKGESALVDGNGSTAAVESGLTQIYELASKYYAGIDNMGESKLFLAEQAAMCVLSRPGVEGIVGAGIENFDFVAFPSMPVNNTVGVGCSGYGINAHSKHKDAAWEFLKFVISKEGQAAFGETGNGVPVLQSMRSDASWRNQPREGMNQEAFVYEGTQDLFLNYYCHAPATLYSDLDTRFQQLIQGIENWDPNSGYDGYKTFGAFIKSKHDNIQSLVGKG